MMKYILMAIVVVCSWQFFAFETVRANKKNDPRNAVVLLSTKSNGSGSGTIVHRTTSKTTGYDEVLILTARHIFEKFKTNEKVTVSINNSGHYGKVIRYSGEALLSDEQKNCSSAPNNTWDEKKANSICYADVALVKMTVPKTTPLTVATFSSIPPKKGDLACAFGIPPLRNNFHKKTEICGIVQNILDTDYTENTTQNRALAFGIGLVHTSYSQSGMSGGPIFNNESQVIGITSIGMLYNKMDDDFVEKILSRTDQKRNIIFSDYIGQGSLTRQEIEKIGNNNVGMTIEQVCAVYGNNVLKEPCNNRTKPRSVPPSPKIPLIHTSLPARYHAVVQVGNENGVIIERDIDDMYTVFSLQKEAPKKITISYKTNNGVLKFTGNLQNCFKIRSNCIAKYTFKSTVNLPHAPPTSSWKSDKNIICAVNFNRKSTCSKETLTELNKKSPEYKFFQENTTDAEIYSFQGNTIYTIGEIIFLPDNTVFGIAISQKKVYRFYYRAPF